MKVREKALWCALIVALIWTCYQLYEFHVQAVETAYQNGRHECWEAAEREIPLIPCDEHYCDFRRDEETEGIVSLLEWAVERGELDEMECVHLGGCYHDFNNLSAWQRSYVQRRQMHAASFEPSP